MPDASVMFADEHALITSSGMPAGAAFSSGRPIDPSINLHDGRTLEGDTVMGYGP
jgi:hypothetical protein